MCFKKSHSELWFQRCLGCCRLTMTARSEDNIQKLVAGGSEAIIQQRDTDSTENEQETFLVVFSKYNEGWITAEELKLLPTHLLGKVQKKYFYFYFMIFQIFPIWQVTVQGDSGDDQDSEQEQGQQWDQNYSSTWWWAPRHSSPPPRQRWIR